MAVLTATATHYFYDCNHAEAERLTTPGAVWPDGTRVVARAWGPERGHARWTPDAGPWRAKLTTTTVGGG
jgi:hypothetical protein